MAYALDGDLDPLKATSVDLLDAQFDAALYALGGDRARIARGGRVTLQAGDVAGGDPGVGQIGG